MKADQEKIYTFNQTVIGSLHIKNDLSCEDASESYLSEDGKIKIAVVADGHGSKEYFRSKEGAAFAAQTAKKILKEFSENYLNSQQLENNLYQDFLIDPRTQKMIVRQLTDTIIAQWYDQIIQDFHDDPPPNASEIPEEEIPRIYGTTLIAALMLPDFVLLIHQGDGRCEVFYGDGSANQPIPWDERCVGNTTTSLCDLDAPRRIRTLVLDKDTDVAAIFLGSDGVDDTYADSDTTGYGLEIFYKNLINEIESLGIEEFEDFLPDFLSEFSEKGKFVNNFSGDDISVSGIVNLTKLFPYYEAFEKDINLYTLKEKRQNYENKLKSMTLKHNILSKRYKTNEEVLSQVHEDLVNLHNELKEKYDEINEIEDQLYDLKDQLEEFESASIDEEIIPKFDDLDSILSSNIKTQLQDKKSDLSKVLRGHIAQETKNLRRKTERLTRKYKKKVADYDQLKDKYTQAELDMTDLEKEFIKSRDEFLNYDEEYSYIGEKILELDKILSKEIK